MRFWQAYQLILLFTANFALALPIANINRAVEATQDPNCSRRDQTSSYRDLIHLASVIGEDDRRVLSQSTVGLTPAEKEQAMRCTGHVYCPNAVDGLGRSFSVGAVCDAEERAAGRCSPDRIATVAHGFINRNSLKQIENVDKCEFRNYRGHRSKLKIEDLRSIEANELFDPAISANERRSNVRVDKTVVRLANPIPGCDPYDIAKSDDLPRPGDEVIAMTYPQTDQDRKKFDGTEPLAYGCSVHRVFAPKGGRSGAFFSDCDVNAGGSGGFLFTRTSNGRLVVAGIISGATDARYNGQPYNADNNYTAAVSVTGDFQQLAKAPGTRPVVTNIQGDTPVARPTNN